MVAYKAPVDEYMFVLHELLRIQDFAHVPGFENVSEELTRQILEGAATFCEEVLQPLNQVGDEQGCVLENGVVRTPDGFAAAYQQYCDAGWNKLAAPEEHRGGGLPGVVALPVSEFSVSANAGLALYSGLTNAAHDTLARSGAAWMQEHIRPQMIEGRWTGTMCLTEPHCGTDLRLMKTKAYEQPDGTYGVTGTKIFISGGDYDLSENIIHLGLAKLPNAEGTFVDDLSTVNFFMIPKFSVDPATGKMLGRNGVCVGGVEKKMGIKGNATCVLNFEDAVAYRLAGRDQKSGARSSSAGMAGMSGQGARLVISSRKAADLEEAKTHLSEVGIEVDYVRDAAGHEPRHGYRRDLAGNPHQDRERRLSSVGADAIDALLRRGLAVVPRSHRQPRLSKAAVRPQGIARRTVRGAIVWQKASA
ncbi:acyl-CoA dehydrogenase family protein [Bradyrhizobium sp.]|jgi:hypothetical protein|uniref:acyl-CoA dehydrogenase family protein n=1 Tax=Bradyrhizobium sp. TaxID=376 RepID=UPI002DDCC5C1|nr:acyl-CoA dehydrogenase family protein [Bradyrhizobium sp.]HEV2160548.1 acyl-CoA dehydrogenase family protein [Bradyrhizobium sp.]